MFTKVQTDQGIIGYPVISSRFLDVSPFAEVAALCGMYPCGHGPIKLSQVFFYLNLIEHRKAFLKTVTLYSEVFQVHPRSLEGGVELTCCLYLVWSRTKTFYNYNKANKCIYLFIYFLHVFLQVSSYFLHGP